ncbi:MAG: Bacterial type secretion system short domain protein [Planctomycetaceae bacterium]|nr:Bacterial type secretion system short domain protein [Planctomycetaceae bacterium]
MKLEIQISPEQETEIRKVETEIREAQDAGGAAEARRARFTALRDAETDEERDKLQKAMQADGEKRQKETDAALKKLLKPEQITRLEQLLLQKGGLSALNKDDGLAQSLRITADQKKKFLEIQTEYDKKVADMRASGFQNVPREDWEKVRTERDAQLDQALTADQRKAWETKIGPPAPKSDITAGGRGGRRERTGGGGGGPRTPGREEKVPEGAVAVADFSAVPADSGPAGVAEKPVDKPAEKTAGGSEKLMSFNFRFAPWELVLKHFAEHAGLTLDLNVVPPGTFNYYDNGKFTVTQALDIINGYLIQKGYILVRRDKFLVVVTVDNIEPNLVPDVAFGDLSKRGRNELVRVILPIEGMSPDAAADEAQELLGPQGKIVPLSKTGRLVVTDIASNVLRIHELLNGMNVVPTTGPTFQSFQLKNVSVMEAEKVVRDLFGLPQRGVVSTPVANAAANSNPGGRFGGRGDFGGGGGDFGGFGGFGRGFGRGGDFGGGGGDSGGRGDRGDRGDTGRSQQPPQTQSSTSNSNVASNSRISVATDLRTNTLMVTAKAEDIKIVEQAIKTLDIDEKTNNQSRNLTGRNSPQLEVYPITTADPRVMIQTINNLVPSAIVNEDAKAKRLHVFATSDEQLQIKALIHQIDGGIEGGETTLVVQLRRHDPMGVAGSLRNLFKGTRDEVPMIEADPIGKRLMVRGSTAQVTEIRQFLKQMGEDPDGNGQPDPSTRGSVRTLSLGGRDPQELAELIEKLWPDRVSNPIRIVVPSSGNQTLKSGLHHIPAGASSQTEPESGQQKRPASVIKTKVNTPIKVRTEAERPAPRANVNVGTKPGVEREATAKQDAATVQEAEAELEAGELLYETSEALEEKTIDDDLEEATADDAADDSTTEVTEPVDSTEITPNTNTPAAKSEQPATSTKSKVPPTTKPSSDGSDTATPKAVPPKVESTEPATAPKVSQPQVSPSESKSEAVKSTVKSVPGEEEGTPRLGKKPTKIVREGSNKPVSVFPSGNNLVISSDDLEALDRLQALVEALAQASPKRQTWTVFYLRTADATETATMLGHLFPSGSVSRTTDPNSQTMMGSLTGGISSMGSSLMDMTGLSSLGAASALRIVPEVRSNALYVSGPADLVRQVEDVLKVLDASELPESLRDRVPRMIPVEHAEVDEVRDIIENVYKDYMQAPAAVPGGGGGGGLNPLALLMAASGGGDKQKGRGIRLTIGVDTRTNSIVVSADESLFKQIEALVKNLDQAALEANRTVRIVNIDATKALLVQQALGSLMGKVKVSSTRGGQGQGPNPFQEMQPPAGQNGGDGRNGRGNRGGDNGNNANPGNNPGAGVEEELRRRFLQGAGIPQGGDNGGGNNGGGNNGGVRGGRGGFGSGRQRPGQ